MAWKFIFFCFALEYIVITGRLLIDWLDSKLNPSLLQLWEQGKLKSERSIDDQILEMSAVDFEGNAVVIEEVDTEMEVVDIEAAKQKLRLKNKELRKEIILEI